MVESPTFADDTDLSFVGDLTPAEAFDTPKSDETPTNEPPRDTAGEAAEIAEIIEQGPRDEAVLANGVRLKLRRVPPLAIREAAIRVPPPKVPTVWIQDREREEENPNDPGYLEAMARYQAEQMFRVADVMMLLGTSIGELPDGIASPESDEWIEMLEALDIPVERVNKHKRYLAWMRLYATEREEDIAVIIGRVAALSGVTEVEVQRAAAAFRSTAGR